MSKRRVFRTDAYDEALDMIASLENSNMLSDAKIHPDDPDSKGPFIVWVTFN
jgi:hypothetical protein